MTPIVWGNACWSTTSTASADALLARRISIMASAAAVLSSSSEALAVCRPVRSMMTVWKLINASSRPWEISGWYGV